MCTIFSDSSVVSRLVATAKKLGCDFENARKLGSRFRCCRCSSSVCSDRWVWVETYAACRLSNSCRTCVAGSTSPFGGACFGSSTSALDSWAAIRSASSRENMSFFSFVLCYYFFFHLRSTNILHATFKNVHAFWKFGHCRRRRSAHPRRSFLVCRRPCVRARPWSWHTHGHVVPPALLP